MTTNECNECNECNTCYTCHHFKDMEFSGLFDITHGRVIFLKYFLFIKFGDKLYIDIKSIGDVIITFKDIQKNKLLKMYYELSLLLVENKNMVNEKISKGDFRLYNYDFLYTEKRDWFIDCAYFVDNFSTNRKEIQKDRYCCYYNINPCDLVNMPISSKSLIDKFNLTFLGYEQIYYFQKKIINYISLAIDYNASLMEKELEEISAIQEDKINIIKLLVFFEKKGMNCDIFFVIYNNLVSIDGNAKYSSYLLDILQNTKLSTAKKKHIVCQIISK